MVELLGDAGRVCPKVHVVAGRGGRLGQRRHQRKLVKVELAFGG